MLMISNGECKGPEFATTRKPSLQKVPLWNHARSVLPLPFGQEALNTRSYRHHIAIFAVSALRMDQAKSHEQR